MASNKIQLFALQVPTQISLPFDLYALTVPEDWKKLFSRLQQIKSGKNYVLPPVRCLNQALQLLIEDLLFYSPKAFALTSNQKWLYSKAKISTDYITTVVKTWLNVSFENTKFLTDADVNEIQSLSASALQFEKVQLPDFVWKIENGELSIHPLYYSLIPYLFANAITTNPLTLIDPTSEQTFDTVQFRMCAMDESNAQEIISWPPLMAIREKKKELRQEKETITHYYCYLATFALHYGADGKPYLNCDYGIRRLVNWELGYLRRGATVCISPTNSTRFAPAKLKYMGKERGIDFEGNLVRLLKELNFQDRFTSKDVVQKPYKNDELTWATTYSNTMSHSHNAGAGLFPIDIEIFHQACQERVQPLFDNGFLPVETYERCENVQLIKKPRSEYKKVQDYIKLHFAAKSQVPPFHIPPNLKLVLLAQSKEAEELFNALAKKYGISETAVYSLGTLGAELSGKNWQTDCQNRIKEFQKALPASPHNQKTLTLVEILPKRNFWKNAEQDPKPCFRPGLARLGSVTDHFEPKDEEDADDFLTEKELNDELTKREDEKEAAKEDGKSRKKMRSLKSEFAYRIETSLLNGLAMAGAYFYPTFEAETFPSNVASVGVYLIPYYNGEKTKYLPVAVRMERTGVTAKAYGCNDWLDFHTLQEKMASGAKEFSAIELDRSKIQSWVFNNLFEETREPTIYCFKASNLRTRGPAFLQKQFWQKHLLAWNTDETTTFIPISKYPNVRVANIITPDTTEVPIYRVCGEDDQLEGHTAGVFYPSSQDAECGYYYLSNQRPESRSGGILNESKLVSLTTTRGDNKGKPKKPKPSSAQGYNPRGIFLNLTLQKGDCFSDWANFVQCLRLYGLIHYLGATTLPAPLHLAAGLEDYRPIQAIREP